MAGTERTVVDGTAAHATTDAATSAGASPAPVPAQRDTSDGRHRVGVPVASIISEAASLDVEGRARRPTGAHRSARRSGRHRAADDIELMVHRRPVDDVDSMAHRRSIGAKLTRGVGRTAL